MTCNTLRYTLLLCCLALAASLVRADDSTEVWRPAFNLTTVDLGHASVLDSYLTPITYGGVTVGVGHDMGRATCFAPERWTNRAHISAEYAYVENGARNNEMHVLMGNLRYAMTHRWTDVLTPGLTLSVGPAAALRGGIVYNAANSNNVVSARIHGNLGALALASYGVRIGRLPITLSYQAHLPVLGAFFSPEYDESYYEIYLGNRRNLAHLGWWGNRFDLDHTLAADLHLGNVLLRVGYHGRIERTWVNNINTHLTTHAVTIGIGGDWLSVGRHRTLDGRKVVNAGY